MSAGCAYNALVLRPAVFVVSDFVAEATKKKKGP